MLRPDAGVREIVYENFQKRGEIRKRLIATGLTFQLGILLMGAVILIILGEFLLGMFYNLVHWDVFTGVMIQVLRWLAILLLFTSVLPSFTDTALPPYAGFRFSPGATLATVLHHHLLVFPPMSMNSTPTTNCTAPSAPSSP